LCTESRCGSTQSASRYTSLLLFPPVMYLPDPGGKVTRHGRQLRRPRRPAVITACREIEVGVEAADLSILRVEIPVGALGDCCVADHRGRVTGAAGLRAEDPQPGVVVSQQRSVLVGGMPLPPAQLRGAPHSVAVDAAELLQAGEDRTIHPGPFGSEESR